VALIGTARADRLSARFDLDQLFGLGGADILTSTDWNDTYLDGGAGNDRLESILEIDESRQDWRLTQAGGLGNDTLEASISGTNWDEDATLVASLSGGAGRDDIQVSLSGSFGQLDTTIAASGGSGADLINITNNVEGVGGLMRHVVWAGDGDDTVVVQNGDDVIRVSNTIHGEGGHDVIVARAVGLEWDGVVDGEASNTITGGVGNDRIAAVAEGLTTDERWTVGTNTIAGDAGHDVIRANSWHANAITGGTGNDRIYATLVEEGVSYSLDTQNFVDGGDGNDLIVANGRSDTNGTEGEYVDLTPNVLENRLLGGNGNDTIRATGSVFAWDGTGSVRNVLLGGAGADNLHAEVAEGSPGANRMFGHDGNDRLQSVGGDGNLLHGGKGRDVLIGGEGGDTFTGAAGADTFVFGSEPGGRDVITDFMADDRIAIVGLVDRGAPGLYDDFVAAVDTVTQARAGAPIELAFADGARIAITAVGVGGAIDSIDDFIGTAQIVSADTLV
jgi:Ca2+-binding RTX toxin-like protein